MTESTTAPKIGTTGCLEPMLAAGSFRKRVRCFATSRALILACVLTLVGGWSGSSSSGQSAASLQDLQTGVTAARQEIATGDFRAAETALRAELGRDDRSAEAHSLLGYALLRLNRPKESLAEYTRTAQLRTPTAEELRNVANDYVLLDDFSDADRWMSQALQMNERDPETWYDLGRIRYTLQRFEEAADCFGKTLELEPRSVKAADNLGLAYEGLDRNEDAIKEYRLALAWQKDSAHPSEQPMLNLATVLIAQGQESEALPLLGQAAGIAPKNPKIHEQLGHLYLHETKLTEAQREFETAVALEPEHGAYHFLLGQVYRRQGAKEKAKAEFDRAAVLDGTHSAEH